MVGGLTVLGSSSKGVRGQPESATVTFEQGAGVLSTLGDLFVPWQLDVTPIGGFTPRCATYNPMQLDTLPTFSALLCSWVAGSYAAVVLVATLLAVLLFVLLVAM
jgi:hypothetical protein